MKRGYFGKILVNGGYLILEPGNPGFVISYPAQTTTTLSTEDLDSSLFPGILPGTLVFKFISPQFRRQFYYVRVDFSQAALSLSKSEVYTEPIRAGPVPLKSFDVSSVSVCVVYCVSRFPDSYREIFDNKKLLVFETLTDTAFYNEKPDSNGSFGLLMSEARKSGLGSSSSFTCSVVDAMMSYFLPSRAEESTTAWVLSLYAHRLAQGGKGSGFDISGAFGPSHIYNIPKGLFSELDPLIVVSGHEYSFQVMKETLFSFNVNDCMKPVSLRIVVFLIKTQVSVGTKSVSSPLFRGIREWSSSDPPLLKKWKSANLSLVQAVLTGSWEEMKATYKVSLFPPPQEYRRCVQKVGEECSAEIEPPIFSPFIDTLMLNDSVIMAGAPGGSCFSFLVAGGYDCLFALTKPGTTTEDLNLFTLRHGPFPFSFQLERRTVFEEIL